MKKILMYTKDNNWCQMAREFVRQNFDVDFYIFPKDDQEYCMDRANIYKDRKKFDYVVSFLCPEILPTTVLNRGKKAINFHPGPPKYPGIGGYNFALYENVSKYGVTCHYMAEIVDSGNIINVNRFFIFENDTVESLKNRSMVYLLHQFYEVMTNILLDKPLGLSDEVWSPLRTKKEFQNLCKCDLSMSEKEVAKRVRACTFPNAPDQPYLQVNNHKFFLKGDDEY